jgi:aldehyde:ferredoxin oxidoreductase
MYDPRLYITNGILYATEPRKPIQQLHEVTSMMHNWAGNNSGVVAGHLSSKDFITVAEKFWGGRAAGDMSTYEGKALAAKKIQDRSYVKESLILCDFLWPIMVLRDVGESVGDPTLESQVFSAITGKETDEEGLNKLGERIFNLQRAIRMREGWGGRQGDILRDVFYKTPIHTARFNTECMVPGPNGEPFSRKGYVVEEDKFEKMKGEYYALRGWDIATGFQTMTGLKERGLADVAADLGKRGLLR